MTSIFWGVKLESGKRYSQSVKAPYHLSMACLETGDKCDDDSKPVRVYLETQGQEYLICSLHPKMVLQQPLDLVLQEDEEVSYLVKGNGVVFLSGYYMPFEDEDEFDDEDMEDESEEEENDVPDMFQRKSAKQMFLESKEQQSKRKAVGQNVSEQNKKAKVNADGAGDSISKVAQKKDDSKVESKQNKLGEKQKSKVVDIPINVEKDEDESGDDDEDDDEVDSDDFEDLMNSDLDEDEEEEDESDEEGATISKMKKLNAEQKPKKPEEKPVEKKQFEFKQKEGKKEDEKSPGFQGKNKPFQRGTPMSGGKKPWQDQKGQNQFSGKKDNRFSGPSPNKPGTPFQRGMNPGFRGKNRGGKFQHKPKPWNSAQK